MIKKVFKTFFIFYLSFTKGKEFNFNFEEGKKLFITNCNICHIQGKNLIIAEKSLKKEALEVNGLTTQEAITYQISNGKNGMPAFGGRLQEEEIEKIAKYILKVAATNNFLL